MKFHRVLVDAVIMALTEIFEDGRQADKVIERILKSDKRWGARDRAFVAENTYEIVRWWRMLDFVTHQNSSAYAKFGAWQVIKEHELPDWYEFKNINPSQIRKAHKEALKIRKIKESIPDWLDEIGEKELGVSWDNELHALNQTAPVVLRTNTLKSNREELRKILRDTDIDSSIISELPDALVLTQKKNVFLTDAFKNGLFEVQDAASQLVAPFLDVEPGMRVIDACAGAGGKSLHLAALMKNKGQLLVMDTEAWKLEELKRRARRNGISNIEPRAIEAKTVKRLRQSADRLLLDVPCTGLGVLRRNPDTKWKMKPDFLNKIREIQFEILQNYASMVKVGGKMVYATCSILPSESEEQVQRFLTENKEWKLLDERRTSPAKDSYDGFYMSCLQK